MTLRAWFVQDNKADDFTSKILMALNNMKIKIPGRNQVDADSIYRQVVLVLWLMSSNRPCPLYSIIFTARCI